jgi:hypothetical protein
MRVISKPAEGPARTEFSQSSAPLPVNGTGPIRFVRGAIRNSPWVAMAVTAHILGITVLSVMYVTTKKETPAEAPGVVTVKTKGPPEESVEEVKPIELVPRGGVPPASTAQEEGVANVNEVVVPEAEAGRPGEITPETDPDKEPGIFNPDPDAKPNLPSGSTGGTPIGVGRFGHHGSGQASAFVSRFAGGGGLGGGGLGQNGKNGVGGKFDPKKTPDTAVFAALQWLKHHQSPDGRWDGAGFDAQCRMNRCDGPGDSAFSTGVTGLSLLAFLGAGETHQTGSCRATVKSGLKWLRDVQDSEGCFGPRTSQHFLYNHACATLAMTEAFGMTGSSAFKAPAQNGIGFILKAKNPYLAWRYNFPADGDNDTSVTGWMVMALKSAKLSGLDIETSAVKDAIAWVEKMTEPEFGRTGYQQRGGPPARTNEAAAKFPNSKSEAMTAVGLTVRIFGGHDIKSDEMIGKGADLLAKCLPKWDVDQGTIDFYYWYYGSLAMFQVGGERWNKWNAAMKTSLLDHQRLEKDRCEYGSWDPIDPWSGEGGRVYATAINCLTMEVYYRYPLLGVRSENTNK